MASDCFLLNVFDAGHRQGGSVLLAEGRLPCFAPLALAGIAKYRFPEQLLERSIIIEMMKQLAGLDELWPNDERFMKARILISAWVEKFKPLQDCRIPFTGRTAKNCKPLIEIAETLGYGETARAALLALHQTSDDPVVNVFYDILRIFVQRGIDRVWTDELLQALYKLENAKWDEFRGLKGNKDPHPLRRGEFYDLLSTKKVESRTV